MPLGVPIHPPPPAPHSFLKVSQPPSGLEQRPCEQDAKGRGKNLEGLKLPVKLFAPT